MLADLSHVFSDSQESRPNSLRRMDLERIKRSWRAENTIAWPEQAPGAKIYSNPTTRSPQSKHRMKSIHTDTFYSDISNRIQIYNLRELSLAWEGFEHKKSQTIWLNTNCWPNLPRYAYFAWKVASIWCSCFQNINVTFDRFIMEVKSTTGT